MHEIETVNNQASTFSVREVPWHGLGTILDNPPTIEEAIKLAGLDWTVSMQPTYCKVDGNDVKLPNRAVVRSTDRKVLGVVGPTYEPLQNAAAFQFFQPVIDEGHVTLETAGSLKGGQRVWILAKVKGGGRCSCSVYDQRPKVCREAVKAGDRTCLNIRRMALNLVEDS